MEEDDDFDTSLEDETFESKDEEEVKEGLVRPAAFNVELSKKTRQENAVGDHGITSAKDVIFHFNFMFLMVLLT